MTSLGFTPSFCQKVFHSVSSLSVRSMESSNSRGLRPENSAWRETRGHCGKPREGRAFVKGKPLRAGDQPFPDLHPLIERQAIEDQQGHLRLARCASMPQEARNVVHHDRPLGDRLKHQIGVVLGCNPCLQPPVSLHMQRIDRRAHLRKLLATLSARQPMSAGQDLAVALGKLAPVLV
jgi:hypothetical protein